MSNALQINRNLRLISPGVSCIVKAYSPVDKGRIMKSSVDKAWDRFQAKIKELNAKALDAEVRSSKWLADGNAALECCNVEKAEKCFAKSQFWLDRYNRMAGRT